MLQHPITLHELNQLIAPSLHVFAQGIQPGMLTQVISIQENTSLPIVTIPLKGGQNLNFKATLDQVNCPSHLQSQGDERQLTYVEKDREQVKIHTIVPWKGDFSLDISVAEKSESTYTTCLLYNIQSDCTLQEAEYWGYPNIWQTVALKSNFCLLSCNTQGKVAHTCRCEGGELKLTFTAHPDANIEHWIERGKSGQSDAFWCFAKMTQDTTNPSLYTLRAVFPSPGWWRVILTDEREVIMSYKVHAECGNTNVLFPCVHPNEANIELVQSQVIEFKDDGNPFELQFHALPTSSFIHDITLLSDNLEKVKTYDNCSLVSRNPLSPNSFTLQAVFPHRGKWAVNLYAGKADAVRIPLAMELKPVNITKPQFDLCFPKVYQKLDEMGFRFTDLKKLMIPKQVTAIPTIIQIPLHVPDEIQTLPKVTVNGEHIHTATKVNTKEQELQTTIDRIGEWQVKLWARSIQAYTKRTLVMEYTIEARKL